jgi:signal transduction histidine kinase
VKPVASRKGIPIEIAGPETGARVRVDARRFVRVLVNLVSNAVKFSEASEAVQVEVEAAGNMVRFHVIDHGIGIDPEDQSLIFRRFAQIDGSLTRKAGGTGLGLSVSRALAERHGGRILVRSRPGEGSRFTVEIPAAAATAAAPTHNAA